MKSIKTTFEKPITGVGTAKIGNKSFSLTITKDEKATTYTFGKDELPDELPETFEIEQGKKYFVSITSDGQSLLNIRPATGHYPVKFIGFSQTKDGDTLIIKRDGEYGEYFQYIAQLEVQSGKNKGIVYPVYLPLSSGDKPRLICDDEGNFAYAGDVSKSKPLQSLVDFLTYSGVIEEDMPFPMSDDEDDEGNPIPETDPQIVLGTLEKYILKKKMVFDVSIADGYVKAMTEAENLPTEEDEEEEEKPVAKKHRKVEEEEEEEVVEKPVTKKKKPSFD